MEKNKVAKPFVKWAGGKTQLLPKLMDIINQNYINKEIKQYIEPFIGGGALFFLLYSQNKIKSAILSDINQDLILVYTTVQKYVQSLITQLQLLVDEYYKSDIESQEYMFYSIRKSYNLERLDFNYIGEEAHDFVDRATKFIFLNRTCFNGLFRQNNKGEFNVPFGKYKKPKICDTDNLIACSIALQDAQIICGDFESSLQYICKNSLIYLDPPYKPISKTSSFTKYHKDNFDDNDQIRLANYIKSVDKLGANIILSNSDPKVANNNDFFDQLYKEFNITRVEAMRNIGSSSNSRVYVKELLINNLG
ncbi:MAG: DNA adenine methylase [Burkholderiales bacterium]|nr:DNA adenine methylase [Burkholderiales bacterium]